MSHPFFDQHARLNRRQFFGTSGRRRRPGRAFVLAWRGDGVAANRGCPVCPIIPRRRNASSFSGKAAGRRTSISSTTSRSFAAWPARTFPTPCAAAHGSPRCPAATADGHACPPSNRSAAMAESGIALSEMLPNIGSLADDICVVRSMNTEAVNHAPGVTFFMTGCAGSRPTRASAPGFPTALAAKAITCRPSW